jgi:hypothetical protein
MQVIRGTIDSTTAIAEYELRLAPSPFEVFASARGHDLTPAVSPSDIRQYADEHTQKVFGPWSAAACYVAGIVTESMLETTALVQRIRGLAGIE